MMFPEAAAVVWVVHRIYNHRHYRHLLYDLHLPVFEYRSAIPTVTVAHSTRLDRDYAGRMNWDGHDTAAKQTCEKDKI